MQEICSIWKRDFWDVRRDTDDMTGIMAMHYSPVTDIRRWASSKDGYKSKVDQIGRQSGVPPERSVWPWSCRMAGWIRFKIEMSTLLVLTREQDHLLGMTDLELKNATSSDSELFLNCSEKWCETPFPGMEFLMPQCPAPRKAGTSNNQASNFQTLLEWWLYF